MTHPSPLCANVWTGEEEHGLSIECLTSVLDEIRNAALEAFDRKPQMMFAVGGGRLGKGLNFKCPVPFGNREAGIHGVLFGKRESGCVRVYAFRQPVTKYHDAGYGGLSESERRALVALIAEARADDKLRGLEPLGWFRAHRTSSWSLSRRDREVFDYFFNEPFHLGMVLRPAQSGPMAAKLFLRGTDGSIQSLESLGQPGDASTAGSSMPLPQPQPPRDVKSHASAAWPLGKARRPMWPALLTLSFALPLGYWWFNRSPAVSSRPAWKPSPAANANALRRHQLEQEAAALWKKWEQESLRERPVENTLPEKFNQEQLNKNDRPPEGAHAPARNHAPAPVRPGSAAIRPAYHTAVVREQPHSDRPPTRSAPAPLAAQAVPAQPAAMSAASSSTPKNVAPQTPAPQAASTEQDSLPPAVPPPAAKAPAAVTNPAAPPVRASVPLSAGRLIWTGRLRKNETVIIDGTHASAGSFIGGLPGTPVRITVWPGELTNNGMVWYTASAERASIVFESPGPQNGWTKTLYMLNPRRASEIAVLEAPSQQNEWRRIVLRNKSKSTSVILVQWTLAP